MKGSAPCCTASFQPSPRPTASHPQPPANIIASPEIRPPIRETPAARARTRGSRGDSRPTLDQPPRHESRHGVRNQIPSRRSQKARRPHQPQRLKNGKPRGAFHQIKHERQSAASRAQQHTHEQHPESLPRDWHGRPGQWDHDVRAQSQQNCGSRDPHGICCNSFLGKNLVSQNSRL